MGNTDLRLPGLPGGHIRSDERIYRSGEGGGGGPDDWRPQLNNEGFLFSGSALPADLYQADSATLDITSDLEIWVEQDFGIGGTGAANQTFVGKWGQNNSYWFGIDGAGRLNFWTRATSDGAFFESTATADHSKSMVRVVYDHAGTGDATFYEKTPAETQWTQVGTAQAHGMGATLINSTADDLMIANHYLGDAEEYQGVIRQVRVYDGIGDARTLAAEMRSEDYSGSGLTFTSGGATWNLDANAQGGFIDATNAANARYGYPFDPFPNLNSAAPLYALTAQDDSQITGTTTVTSVNNLGSEGGTFAPGSNNGPELIPDGIAGSTLGNRAALDFVQSNSEALHSSVADPVSSPMTWIFVRRYDNPGTSVFWASSENGAENGVQHWESGATNYNINSGSTRSATGIDTNNEVVWGVMGNSTTHPQLAAGATGVELAAGSTGANDTDGISIGSNWVPETVNTFDGKFGMFAIWEGDFGLVRLGGADNADNNALQVLADLLFRWYAC